MFNTTFIMKLFVLNTTFIMFQLNKKDFYLFKSYFFVSLQRILITTCLMFLMCCI